MMTLSICVPAYNEQASLVLVVEALLLVLRDSSFEAAEILIVNDGSTDSTGAIADGLARENPQTIRVIHHAENQGYGSAYRTGLEHARYQWYALVPADGQFDPKDLTAMAACARDADLVLGTRTERDDPLHRKLNTHVFRFVVRTMFKLPYQDINWVKLGKTDKLRGLGLESKGIGIDTELVARAHGLGWKIREVETGYLPRFSGEGFGASPMRVLRTVLELWSLKPKLARPGCAPGGGGP